MAIPVDEMMRDLAAADAAGDTQLANHIAGLIRTAQAGGTGAPPLAAAHAPDAASPEQPRQPSGPLQQLAETGDLALALGSRAVAYPLGVAAAAGKFLSPWERAKVVAAPGETPEQTEEARTARAWKAAGEQRHAVEQALTYEPRTENARGAMDILATLTKPVRWLGEKAGNAAAAGAEKFGETPAQQERARALAEEGVQLGLMRLGKGATKPPAQGTASVLRNVAERAAVRSTNTTRQAARQALRHSDQARSTLGGFMLDEGVPLRTPKAIRDASRAIEKEYGPKLEKLTTQADQAGARVNLQDAVRSAMRHRSIQELNANPVSRPAYNQIVTTLQEWLVRHGKKSSVRDAHSIREQADRLANWEQTAPAPVKKAWRTVRRKVNAELDKAMADAGLSAEWQRTNYMYGQASKLSNSRLKGMADIGAERRAHNAFMSPSETGVTIGGLGIAGLMHNPQALAVIPAWWAARRYGMPVTARTANAMSHMARGFPATVGPAAATSLALGDEQRNLTPEEMMAELLRQKRTTQ